jgi:cysteine desulfurase/selenocysteine lyase
MIASVSFEKSTWNELPYKFEAGTPNVAGVIALGAALDWVNGLGLDAVASHEHALLEHGTRLLSELRGVTLVGTAKRKAGVLSFLIDGVHPHDVGTVLDHEGIAVRTGHHCAQPVMERFGIPATTRASLAVFNTKEELDALASGIGKVQEMFG